MAATLPIIKYSQFKRPLKVDIEEGDSLQFHKPLFSESVSPEENYKDRKDEDLDEFPSFLKSIEDIATNENLRSHELRKHDGSISPQKKSNLYKRMHIFSVGVKNLAIIILQHPTKILIGGACVLEPLIGGLLVHGYELFPKSKRANKFFSSEKLGYLPVATLGHVGNEDSLQTVLNKLGAMAMMPTLSQVMNKNSVLLIVRRPLNILCINYALKLMRCPLTQPRTALNIPPLERLEVEVHKPIGRVKIIEMISIQKEVLQALLESIRILEKLFITPVILVCGVKQAGKSTLIRFLINGLLTRYNYVYYLEMDPAQTEFTPPGIVSLVKVENPLLGPSFTHLIIPEKAVYIGEINVTETVQVYHTAMKNLVAYYYKNSASIPLFINTMGRTAGLGESLLVDLMRYSVPTHVLQMAVEKLDHKSKHASMPEMTPQYVKNARGWGSNQMKYKCESQYSCITIPAITRKHSSHKISSTQARDLTLCTYFGKLQRKTMITPINYFSPYCVPWAHIAVCFCSNNVLASQVFPILNASLVALCRVDPKLLENSKKDSNIPLILPDTPLNEWLGFGIIRAVDITKKSFYVTTPEPEEVLIKVNALFHGSIQIPESIFSTQEVQGPVPYMSTIVDKNTLIRAGHYL